MLPTNEARARANQIAAGFDHDGSDAAPVLFGSHRRAQGVEAGDERLNHEQLLAALDR